VTGTGPGTGTRKGPSSPAGSKQKPKASGSVGGLATGHPKLKFKVTDANRAKIASVAIGLPVGLKFARSAIVSHKDPEVHPQGHHRHSHEHVAHAEAEGPLS
jgi:hypothetical protein